MKIDLNIDDLTMNRSTPSSPHTIDVARTIPATPSAEECATLRSSLMHALPEIPPRYFYDDVGSALFERITGLAVYYQTRTEISLLEKWAGVIMDAVEPRHIVELGSGAGRKIRLLFEAWSNRRRGGRCTMLDINELFLRQSITQLDQDYPGCHYHGVVGDFTRDLDRVGPAGQRLIVFFAGTIGNLYPDERFRFFSELAATMDDSDAVLVGVDLVKEKARLDAAYNDPDGVTADFNRNILAVLNRRFDGDFVPASFAHRAFYDETAARIEMRLVAQKPMLVNLGGLGMKITLGTGQEIRTEISCKFTRESLTEAAVGAGLVVAGWYSDPEELFALALLRKREGR